MYSAFFALTPSFLFNVLYASVLSAPLHSIYILAPLFFYVSIDTYQLFYISALILIFLHIKASDLLYISTSTSISILVLCISAVFLLFCVLTIPHIRCISVLLYISSCIYFSTYQCRTSTHCRTSTQRCTSALLHISHSAYKVHISSFTYQLLY